MNKAELIKALAELLAEKMEIGEEPTNGEVLQAVFPNCLINKTDNWVNIHIDTLTPFSRKWWNAPYQKRGE